MEFAAAEEVELAYDDGTLEWRWWKNTSGIGGMFAVYFTPTFTPFTLTKARFYLAKGGPFRVVVFDCAGVAGGGTCSRVGTKDAEATNTSSEWFEVDLTSLSLTMKGAFYVALEWVTGEKPEIGVDTSSGAKGRSYNYDRPSNRWSPFSELAQQNNAPDGNIMIRATIRTPEAAVSVDVEPHGIPFFPNIDGNDYKSTDLPIKLKWAPGSTHTISVQDIIQGDPGVRYVFVQWSDGNKDRARTFVAIGDLTIKAVYKVQYLLTIKSEFGNPQGSDWYDAGTDAKFSVTNPAGFIIQQVLQRWTGASSSNSASASVKMDGPKTVVAEWRADYTQAFLLVGGLVAAIGAVVRLKRVKRAPKAATEQVMAPTMPPVSTAPTAPPQQVGTIYCPQCGFVNSASSRFCESCGSDMKVAQTVTKPPEVPSQVQPVARPVVKPEIRAAPLPPAPVPVKPSPQPVQAARRVPFAGPMVQASNLSVAKQGKTIIDRVSFAIERGEILGLLGPSGAGKTSIIRTLITEDKPTSGHVTISGFDTVSQAQQVRRIFGYVPQDIQLYEDLSFSRNVIFFGSQYGVDEAYLRQRAVDLARIVELADKIDQKVSRLSGGQKKRVSVATALAHDPELLVLDEPTSGLDPATRRSLWRFLKSLNQTYRVTMVITTHYLDEGEFCDKLLIINKGKVVAFETPLSLKRSMPGGGKAIEIELFTMDEYVAGKLAVFESKAKGRGIAEMVDRSGYRMKVYSARPQESMPKVVQLLGEEGLGVKSVNLVDVGLEDVFVYLTGEKFEVGE